mgnify:CR=1 FL=1
MDNFQFKKSLGQNFIKDDNIIAKIVNYSDIDKDTLVIEIGPGSGALSKKIVPISGYTILYEIDERLREKLDDVLKENTNYEIVFGDFLEQDISSIRNKFSNYKKVYVVANLPYYITTPIIIKLLKEIYPDKIVIMVQDEVADRLCSQCGSRDYAMISVLLGSKYNIKKLFKVSRSCFVPIPKVDSAVIMMNKCDKLGNVSFLKFEKLIKDAFRFKRKSIKNNLKEYDLTVISIILDKYGFSLQSRAEELPISIFIEICSNL